MFFGDKIIKEHYSVGVVHVRGINNGTEQGAVKYIFFVFLCREAGLRGRGYALFLSKNFKKHFQPIHLFQLGALQTWQTLKV